MTTPHPPQIISEYQARTRASSDAPLIRGMRYHVLRWNTPHAQNAPSISAAPIVMVHGWMDVAASFQFVVDALQDTALAGRPVLAPDWRGYGQTHVAAHCDNFWFPDYMADLDFLLDHYFPNQPVDLIGHSMGGNVAMVYAGVRPERIRRLVNLEGFGMPRTEAQQAPKRYAQWMDELKKYHAGELTLKSYASAEAVAHRLCKTNPRLAPDKALWLAQHWACPRHNDSNSSEWHIQGHAAHKIVNAQLYRVEEILACYAQISAPTLSVHASHNQLEQWWQGRYGMAEYLDRLKHVPRLQTAEITDAGHMLHHDQPQALAQLLADFLT